MLFFCQSLYPVFFVDVHPAKDKEFVVKAAMAKVGR